MSHSTPLLRPMAADALKPRPSAQAAKAAPQADPSRPLQELEALIADFSAEEDEDFQDGDFCPTDQMPTPVSVPLFDLSDPPKGCAKGWKIALLALALLLLAALAFWQRESLAALGKLMINRLRSVPNA